MRKHFIGALLILSIILTLFSIPAYAEEEIASGNCGDYITWTLDQSGTLTFRGTGEICDYSKGAVNQPWINYRKSITELIIEDGITRIGDRAFQSCTYIERVVIGKDVVSIGEWAFQNCYSLTSVELSPRICLELGAFRNTPVEWEISAVESPLYTNSNYYSALSQVVITGNYRDDIINIALSQIGYHEGDSDNDYAGYNTSGTNNYTEYGRYLGSDGKAWCSEFASWCIRMAGVPTQIVASSRDANVSNFTKNTSAAWYTWNQLSYGGGSYTPQKGDILLWAWDKNPHSTDESLSHTSILWEIEEDTGEGIILKTVDGNSGNQVRDKKYELNSQDGSLIGQTGKLCYVIAPDYESNQLKKYYVSFYTDDNNNATTKMVANGGLYGVLPTAHRAGDTFLGWFTQVSGGTHINPYKPVHLTDHQTLYARWYSPYCRGCSADGTSCYGHNNP